VSGGPAGKSFVKSIPGEISQQKKGGKGKGGEEGTYRFANDGTMSAGKSRVHLFEKRKRALFHSMKGGKEKEGGGGGGGHADRSGKRGEKSSLNIRGNFKIFRGKRKENRCLGLLERI